MPIFAKLLLAVLVLIAGIAHPDICNASDNIRINGSGTALDMMKPLLAAYRKNNNVVSVEMGKPLGSSGAVKALLAGALDVAVISRNLTPDEVANGAQLRKFGKTPLVIATEKNIHKSDITTKELEDIYAGNVGTWPNGVKIRLILRPKTDADTQILRLLSPGMNNAISISHTRPGMIIAITDPESYSAIMKTPGGVGTSGMNSVISEKLPLTILSLNGVKPSLKTLANGTYPLSKDISFVTTSKPNPATRKLISFIYSPKGRAIAERAGVLVTTEPEVAGH